VFTGIATVAASTCSATGGQSNSGYYYSGQYTIDFPTYSYDGVEGSISNDTLTVANYNQAHNIHYIDESTGAQDCGVGNCWIQNGYGRGDVGGQEATYNQAYAEVDGYGKGG
jgi:hypothetical protein